MSLDALTPQILADTTLQLLIKEEELLQTPRSSRQYRWLEERKIDLTIRDGTDVIATIEMKGPFARNVSGPTYLTRQVLERFQEHLDRLSEGLPGECYSIWILPGRDESQVKSAFDLLLNGAAKRCAVLLV